MGRDEILVAENEGYGKLKQLYLLN